MADRHCVKGRYQQTVSVKTRLQYSKSPKGQLLKAVIHIYSIEGASIVLDKIVYQILE